MPPLNIEFRDVPNPGAGEIEANRAYARTLGLPMITLEGIDRRITDLPLAVVGGGPSIEDHAAEIRDWPGPVWAINGAVQWCIANGRPDAALFTIEHEPREEYYHRYAKGVRTAVLGSLCRPVLFDLLLGQGADVKIFDLAPHGGFACGNTSATIAPVVGFASGHKSVTLFGCKSSFRGLQQHAYDDEDNAQILLLQVGPYLVRTSPQFLAQAQRLSGLIREFPHAIKERSGGLLRAMVEHGVVHEIIGVSRRIAERAYPGAVVRTAEEIAADEARNVHALGT